MLKPPPPKVNKKKRDLIVRITNKGGFGMHFSQITDIYLNWAAEFGRLPQEVATWVSRLLDLGEFSIHVLYPRF